MSINCFRVSVQNLNDWLYLNIIFSRVAAPNLVDKVVGPSDGTYNNNNVTALSKDDIQRYVSHFQKAAIRAMEECNFDGVEIHGA